jgi:hypothetical protein
MTLKDIRSLCNVTTTLWQGHNYVNDINNVCNSATELWQGRTYNNVNNSQFEQFYHELYNHVLKILNINPIDINTSLWQDEPYLLNTYNCLENQYKNIDILIINNVAQSGQYPNNKPINVLAEYLNNRFNVVVTTPINDTIKCTKGLTIQQYGAISTHCKYVIAVFSGSMSCCYNSISMKNVKKWFFFAQGVSTHPSINYVSITNNDINLVKHFFDTI